MLGLFSKKESASVEWSELNDVSILKEIDEYSKEEPVLIFKHSTRCPISSMSLSRFERSFESEAAFKPYFLDLITYREVSNTIAEKYGVAHESPQAILIHDGKAVYHNSHNGIDFEDINNNALQLT